MSEEALKPNPEEEIARTEWNALTAAEEDEKVPAFMGYCMAVIAARDAEAISIQEASYKICGATSLVPSEALSSLEEAIDIACDLELPQGQRKPENRDEQISWQKLKDLFIGA